MICESCGVRFERPGSRGPIPKFCSGACRQAAHRARHRRAGWLSMPAHVARALALTSPRLFIDKPVLINVPGIDGGWLLVIPEPEPNRGALMDNGREPQQFTELISEIREVPTSSLLVNVDWLDLVDRYDEDKAWEIVGKLHDLLR